MDTQKTVNKVKTASLTPGGVVCMFVYNNLTNDSRVFKQAASLVKAGCIVHVIAVWKQGLARKEILNNIVIHRLDNVPLHIRLIGQEKLERLKKMIYGNAFVDSSQQNGHTGFGTDHKTRLGFVKFFISTVKKILFYSNFYLQASAYLRENNIRADVYHCHDLNTLYIGQTLAGRHKAGLVYDAHELYVYRNRPYIPPELFLQAEKLFEAKYIQKADAVITVSRSIARYMAKTYNIAEPYLIMNAPVKKAGSKKGCCSLRRALNIKDSKKILLYAGGITFSRGLDKVIASLVEEKDLFFVMLGYGLDGLKDALTALAEKHGVADRVAFFGPVASNEVTAWAASADIGVAAIENVCLSYYYCAPNKVFEYIQGGLPVVASNFPDLKSIVETNDIGCTCDISDPKQIAATVNKVFDNYPVYQNNVKKLQDKYCWENEEQKLIQLYAERFSPA